MTPLELGIKLAEVPYWQTAAAGLDPTGYYTFQKAKEETNRRRDNVHMGLGAVTGALSGLAIVPSATGAVLGGLRHRPTKLTGEALSEFAKSIGRGALAPYKAVYEGHNASKALQHILDKGEIRNPGELASIANKVVKIKHPQVKAIIKGLQDAPEGSAAQQLHGAIDRLVDKNKDKLPSAVQEHIPSVVGAVKGNVSELLPGHKGIPINEPMRHGLETLHNALKSRTTEAASALGASAALGTGSALVHYHMGKRTGQELRGDERKINKLEGQI